MSEHPEAHQSGHRHADGHHDADWAGAGGHVPYADAGPSGPTNPTWGATQVYPYPPSAGGQTQPIGYAAGYGQQPGEGTHSPYGQQHHAPAYGPQPYAGNSPYSGAQHYGTAPWPPHHHVGPYPGMPFAPPIGGIDPLTGEPLSDKSKIVAGLLQFFFGVFGVGRFYIGDSRTGGLQLALGLVGFFGSFILIGFPFLVIAGIWALIDTLLMLTGSVRDPYGRKLS